MVGSEVHMDYFYIGLTILLDIFLFMQKKMINNFVYWLSIPPITRAPRDHDSLVPSTSQHAYDEQPVKTTPKLTNKSNAH